MAIQKGFSTPTLVINNVSVAYVPNTLSSTPGIAEKKIRTASGGGEIIERVSTINVETKFSLVKFQLLATAANYNLAEGWTNNDFNNAISITDTGFTKFGSNAGVTNNWDFAYGVDGKVDIEFQCDSLV